MREIEAGARELWRIGNERIGHREWDDVREHYLREAKAVLEAAGFERVSRALAEAEKDAEHWKGTAIRTAEDLARSADRLAEAEKERDALSQALNDLNEGARAAEERAAQAEGLLREAREALRDAFLVIARQNPLSIPEIKRIDRASMGIDAALSTTEPRAAASEASLKDYKGINIIIGGGAQGEEK